MRSSNTPGDTSVATLEPSHLPQFLTVMSSQGPG